MLDTVKIPIFDVKIKIFPHGVGLDLPQYQTIFSSGMDLLSAIESDITLNPMENILVPTGIAIELENGYEAQIRSRSGLATKNAVIVLNSPGTIDADYRGEIKVCIMNLGKNQFIITRGMRIAQMVISQVTKIKWKLTNELTETQRNDGGFGSTGI